MKKGNEDKTDNLLNTKLNYEKNDYNKFFNSKKYIPVLKANKNDIDLFLKIIKKNIENNSKNNIYLDIINFLCTNFPEQIGHSATLWNECKTLFIEKLILTEFFKQLKINSEILNHFFNCGYDSIETFLSIKLSSLIKIQKFNNVIWLPGHSFRIKVIFLKINQYYNIFYEKNKDYILKLKKNIIKDIKKIKVKDTLKIDENIIPKDFKIPKVFISPKERDIIPYIIIPKNEKEQSNKICFKNNCIKKFCF